MMMAWVNRAKTPLENLDPGPDYTMNDLRELLEIESRKAQK
jgi:hypothetical protein